MILKMKLGGLVFLKQEMPVNTFFLLLHFIKWRLQIQKCILKCPLSEFGFCFQNNFIFDKLSQPNMTTDFICTSAYNNRNWIIWIKLWRNNFIFDKLIQPNLTTNLDWTFANNNRNWEIHTKNMVWIFWARNNMYLMMSLTIVGWLHIWFDKAAAVIN